jgi:hypothetical protein
VGICYEQRAITSCGKTGRAKPEENEVAGAEVAVAGIDGREGEAIHWQKNGGDQDRDQGRKERRALRVRGEAGSRGSQRARGRREICCK